MSVTTQFNLRFSQVWVWEMLTLTVLTKTQHPKICRTVIIYYKNVKNQGVI